MAQDFVFLLVITQLVGVKADVLKHIPQLGDIGLFDSVQRLVDALAVAWLVAMFKQAVEIRLFRQHKTLGLHQLGDQLRLVPMLGLVGVVMILPDIADVFEKQHGEDVVLVDTGIDDAAEAVASTPYGLVDGVMIDLVIHCAFAPGVLSRSLAMLFIRVSPLWMSCSISCCFLLSAFARWIIVCCVSSGGNTTGVAVNTLRRMLLGERALGFTLKIILAGRAIEQPGKKTGE